MKAIATGFGGINLEGIAASRCFEIEERLRNELDVPETGTFGDVMTVGLPTGRPTSRCAKVARMRTRQPVVSDLDLVAAIGTAATAGMIAAAPVVTVKPECSLDHAARLLAEHETSHLIVRLSVGLPIGVISTLDVARAIVC